MEYTKNEDSVVFLKDTDIVQDIDGNNTSGDAATAVAKNGVASFDLVSSLSATSLSVDNVISANISALCANTDEEFSNTSSYIDTQDELLSGQISTLSGEVTDLSGKFVAEQEFNNDTYHYLGEVELKDSYSVTNKLHGLLLGNAVVDGVAQFPLRKGYTFKTVGDATKAYNFGEITLHSNEYLTINEDVAMLSDVTFDDINIIKDYDLSVSMLVSADTQMRTDFNQLTTEYSATSADFDGRISQNKEDADALRDDVDETSATLTALNGEFDSHVESYGQLCTDLSNAITATNNSISSPISGVALSISNEKTTRESQTSFLSGVISDDISTAIDSTNTNLATSAVALTTAIEAIRADVKGGVNYKGHLKLTDEALGGIQLNLTGYISALYAKEGKTPAQIAEMNLSNGWMYYIDFNPKAIWPGVDTTKGTFTTLDGITFVPGNYIIVHSHDTTLSDGIPLTAATSANLDMVKVTDSDLVRRNELALSVNDLCGILSNAVSTLAVDGISASARAEFDSTSAWINGTIAHSLSTDYNIKFEAATNARSAICTDISNALTAHIQDFDDHVDAYEQLCSDLSGAIDDVSSQTKAKVQISSYGNPTATSVDVLKINRMTAADYAAKVAADQILSTELYCITDDEMNAYGKKILSVAAPENGFDAANKNYVDDVRTYASNVSGAARTEFDSTSTYIGQVSTALCNTIKADYALSADGKFVKLSVQTATTLSNATAQNLTATTLSANSLSVVDSKTSNLTVAAANATRLTTDAASCTTLSGSSLTAVNAKASALTANSISSTNLTTTNATVAKISATRLEVADGQFVLSTGNTAINITTQTGLADVRVNGIPVANTLSSLSANSINVAKAYSDSLSNALSGTARSEIATALADAKDYTDDLSTAVDGKFTDTSTYINTQAAAASTNAYLSVYNGLSSKLDSSNNHLELYIGDKRFANYKLHNVLQNAALSDVDGQKAIVFYWNTAAGVENATSVLVQELIDTYNADETYIKLSAGNNTFYLDFNLLYNALGVGGLSSKATTLETSAINFNSRIGALESDNTTNKGNIQTLSTVLTAASTGVNAQLTAHDARITTNSNSINSINSQIGNILTGSTNSISSIINRLDSITDPAISQNAADIATNAGSINAIKSFLSVGSNSIDAKVASNSDTIAGILVDVGSLQTSVDTINTNLATTTAKADAYASVSATYVTTTALNTTLGSYETTADLTANYYNKTAADAAFAQKDSSYLKSETSSSIEINNAFNAISNTYYTKEVADERFATASEITGTLSAYYSKVDADAVFETKTHATQTYATIANADAKYAEIAHTSSDSQLATEFAKYQLTANMDAYQLTSDMTAYYNATSADSTFATKTAVNSGIVAKLSAIAEAAVEKFADPSNVADISAVADKLNKLIDAVEEIRDILSSLTSIS